MKHTEGEMKIKDMGGSIGCRPLMVRKPGKTGSWSFKEIACSTGLHDDSEDNANMERIVALWNAANGMTTEEAVKLLNMEAMG